MSESNEISYYSKIEIIEMVYNNYLINEFACKYIRRERKRKR